mmetsp:Transcript_3602/g.5461  ORF Transcript_3602/g.5461 Transcript_3602/m.5461 type:complete len:199 (+) Transcript_3602:142-738(+)
MCNLLSTQNLLAFLFLCITATAKATKQSLCDRLDPEKIPPECTCEEAGNFHIVVDCTKSFDSDYLNNTIGMKVDLDVCNSKGSSVTLDVTEQNHQIDFPIETVRAGEAKKFPIPGVSVIFPGAGSLGLDAAVLIAGNPDMLILKIGLDTCLHVHTHEICASSVPGLNTVLPWYILGGTYSFGNICGHDSNGTAVTAII